MTQTFVNSLTIHFFNYYTFQMLQLPIYLSQVQVQILTHIKPSQLPIADVEPMSTTVGKKKVLFHTE